MFDGHWNDGTLVEATEMISRPFPLSKLVVQLPIRHNEDPAIFTWSIREGENAQFSRHPNPIVRAKFACALALRAHENLEEVAEVAAEGGDEIELLS